MPSSFTITKLTDLTISVASDGVITLSYPGQTTVTILASQYRQWYTYGVLGSGTNPLTFVSKSVAAPTGLKTDSYANDAHLALSLGTNGAAKYAINGTGDVRPSGSMTAISVCVDNESCNSGSASYPNYLVVYTSGSGAGATLTLYHP
jgi:hypothetical protein